MRHVAWSHRMSGMKVSEVTCKLKLSHSTVSTVLNSKDELLYVFFWVTPRRLNFIC